MKAVGLAGALGDMHKPQVHSGVVMESGGAKYSLDTVSDGNCFKMQLAGNLGKTREEEQVENVQCMLAILTLRRLRQENCHEFDASLCCIETCHRCCAEMSPACLTLDVIWCHWCPQNARS